MVLLRTEEVKPLAVHEPPSLHVTRLSYSYSAQQTIYRAAVHDKMLLLQPRAPATWLNVLQETNRALADRCNAAAAAAGGRAAVPLHCADGAVGAALAPLPAPALFLGRCRR